MNDYCVEHDDGCEKTRMHLCEEGEGDCAHAVANADYWAGELGAVCVDQTEEVAGMVGVVGYTVCQNIVSYLESRKGPLLTVISCFTFVEHVRCALVGHICHPYASDAITGLFTLLE